MRRSSHLSDDRLVEVCFDSALSDHEVAHLDACDGCAVRRSRLELLLREVGDAAVSEADAAFPDDRLAAQHARILQRVEHDGRPARVIAFPAAAAAAEIRPLRARPAGRWVAGAAAAGLAIGLLAGHLAHDLPTNGRPARVTDTQVPMAQTVGATPAMRTTTVALSDEEILGQIETALDGPTLAVLRPLNDLTPR